MSRRQSFCLTLGILLLAVAVRAAPYLDRVGRFQTTGDAFSTRSGAGEAPAHSATDKVPRRGPRQSATTRGAVLAAEALLLGAMLYWMLRAPLVGAAFGALPVSYRAGAAALLTALVVGLVGGTDGAFPFTPWRMYAGDMRPGDVNILRFIATTASGRSFRLDLDALIPVLGSQRLYQPLALRARRIQREEEPARRAALLADQQAAFQALARLYNRRHADDPLTRIAIWTATLARGDLYRRPEAVYREIWSIGVD